MSSVDDANEILTKNLFDLGCTSRNTRANAAASPIQRIMRPRIRRTSADIGVKFPKAFERRKRGNASCSIARKQYSFCAWNMSGIWAISANSVCDLGSDELLSGKLWMRSAGGR